MTYQEDTRERNVRIGDHSLASLRVLDHTRLGLTVLLRDQRRNIRLESTGSEAEGNDAEDERHDGLTASKNTWYSRYDEKNMTEDRKADGDKDGVEATEVLISNDSTF